jgi:hypothetical protein
MQKLKKITQNHFTIAVGVVVADVGNETTHSFQE